MIFLLHISVSFLPYFLFISNFVLLNNIIVPTCITCVWSLKIVDPMNIKLMILMCKNYINNVISCQTGKATARNADIRMFSNLHVPHENKEKAKVGRVQERLKWKANTFSTDITLAVAMRLRTTPSRCMRDAFRYSHLATGATLDTTLPRNGPHQHLELMEHICTNLEHFCRSLHDTEVNGFGKIPHACHTGV